AAHDGFAGTPAYAAPECLAGAPADEHSDQYSFCVCLHEALFGTRPSLAGAPPRRLPGGEGVPARIRRILARGLAADAAARFPTMDDLLAALARDPWARLRRTGAAALVAAVAVGATYALTGDGAG